MLHRIHHLTLLVSVRLWQVKAALSRRLTLLLAGAFATATAPAQAADDLFGMFDHVADGAENSTDDWEKLAKFGGWGCCVVGLGLMIAKKKNPQLSWGLIGTFWAVGFCLIALEQFINKGQSTIDLTPTT